MSKQFTPEPDPERILVIHGGALGDLVLFIPTLKLIRRRFPNANIVLLGSPYSGQALVGLTYINSIVLTKPRSDPVLTYLQKVIELRRAKFDLLIDVHGTSRSRNQMRLIRPKKSIAMQRGDIHDRAYSEVVAKKVGVHMVGEYVGLIEHFGLPVTEGDLDLELPIVQKHRDAAGKILLENGIAGPYVVIQPTTSGRPSHEVWPTENFARVAEFLAKSGYQVLASSDLKGIEMVEQIKRLAKCPIINLAGKTDALTLAALLERASMMFGYNTGPMHVAAAVDIPIVAIFERPGKYVPWHPWTKAPWQVLIPNEEKVGEKAIYPAKNIGVADATKAIRSVLTIPD